LPPSLKSISILSSRQGRKAPDNAISLINQIGLALSRTQGLTRIIVTLSSFSNSDNKLYILVADKAGESLDLSTTEGNLGLWNRNAGLLHISELRTPGTP
jgi:hypothetical protein